MNGHWRYRRLIERMFPADPAASQPLSAPEWDRLFAHLRDGGCLACQAFYDQRRQKVSPTIADPEALVPAESAAMLAVLNERVRNLVAAGNGTEPRRSAKAWRWRWPAVGALATAALAVVVLYARVKTAQYPLYEPPETRGARRPSADYYCQASNGEKLLVRPGDPCPVGATIRVRAHSVLGLPFVSLVMCDRGLRCQLTARARAAGAPEVNLISPPVPYLDRLQLFVLWSPGDIADRAVSRAVDILRNDGRCVHEVDELPLTKSEAQVSFWIRPKRIEPN